ncbi:MAG: hypothetical protein U5R14_15190 [Gemmatimonadota bacterium]|nr:hypothetical protein [Gemmatimonadota bacterium]
MGGHRSRWLIASMAVLVTGCGGRSSQPPGFESVGTSAPTETAELMLRHYDHARTLSSAAIFGDEGRARASATAIHEEDDLVRVPGDAEDEYRAFQASVASVEEADGREELARSAATVARECGDCHLASGLGPTFSVGRPDEVVTPRDHLRVLAWGSSRMWESLVGGSDLAWRAGARALSGELLREELYASRVSDAEIDSARALSEQLHGLGVEALATSTRNERARVLGEIWGTCSACHELVGIGRS